MGCEFILRNSISNPLYSKCGIINGKFTKIFAQNRISPYDEDSNDISFVPVSKKLFSDFKHLFYCSKVSYNNA